MNGISRLIIIVLTLTDIFRASHCNAVLLPEGGDKLSTGHLQLLLTNGDDRTMTTAHSWKGAWCYANSRNMLEQSQSSVWSSFRKVKDKRKDKSNYLKPLEQVPGSMASRLPSVFAAACQHSAANLMDPVKPHPAPQSLSAGIYLKSNSNETYALHWVHIVTSACA